MSRKLTLYLVAAASVVLATLLGAWTGWRTAQTPINVSNPKPQVKTASGPAIAFPPQLADGLASQPIQATSAALPADNAPPEIIPGGIITGQTVSRMWETTASQPWKVRPAPLTPPNWFITGVVKRGEQTQVIVQFDGEPQPRFLKIGDTLPGGGKLGWVRPDAIGVITPNRKKLSVSLLANETTATPTTPKPSSTKSAKPYGR